MADTTRHSDGPPRDRRRRMQATQVLTNEKLQHGQRDEFH